MEGRGQAQVQLEEPSPFTASAALVATSSWQGLYWTPSEREGGGSQSVSLGGTKVKCCTPFLLMYFLKHDGRGSKAASDRGQQNHMPSSA